MATAEVRWARLIAEHHRNQARLESERAQPPPFWTRPLGLFVPWALFAVAVVGRRDVAVLSTAVTGFAMLGPVGLACLFVERLRTITAGLVIGVGTSLFTALALFG